MKKFEMSCKQGYTKVLLNAGCEEEAKHMYLEIVNNNYAVGIEITDIKVEVVNAE